MWKLDITYKPVVMSLSIDIFGIVATSAVA